MWSEGTHGRNRRWGTSLNRTPKRSELVALEIVREIVQRNLSPGDALPTEAEMVANYGASRASIREALRLLEVQGLITIRPGTRTGTVVADVSSANLGRTLTLYLHMLGITYDELVDAWTITEPFLARRAALNPDRERVKALMSPFDVQDGASSLPASEGVGFHETVADLAGNRVLSLTMRAIASIQIEHTPKGTHGGALAARIVHDHADVARAIIAGDADLAERLMQQHANHIVEDFRAVWPQMVGERIEWR